MSMKSKIVAALAVVTVVSATLAPMQAEARRWHGGGLAVAGAAGLATGLLLGGALAAPAYAAPVVVEAEPRRVCSLQDRFNRFGEYVRTVRICRVVY